MPRQTVEEASPSAGVRVATGSYGIAVRAALAAALLVAVKWLIHFLGLEIIETLPLLTALLGGVVFTLAIILAGVFADFKESERSVGELASLVRRLHWDLGTIASGERLAAMRKDLFDVVRALVTNLRDGRAMHMREVFAPMAALDARIIDLVRTSGPSPVLRTVQMNLGSVMRIADRIEVVIETTFMKPGYTFAGLTVFAAVAGLTFADLEPFQQGIMLYGFACFLLVGLTILVRELDNPFLGSVRLSIRQLEKVEAFLAEQM